MFLVLVGVGVEGPEAGDNEMSDEQEDIGLSMTTNDELRLCGLTGDDEDDVAGDAEELFGRRAFFFVISDLSDFKFVFELFF